MKEITKTVKIRDYEIQYEVATNSNGEIYIHGFIIGKFLSKMFYYVSPEEWVIEDLGLFVPRYVLNKIQQLHRMECK